MERERASPRIGHAHMRYGARTAAAARLHGRYAGTTSIIGARPFVAPPNSLSFLALTPLRRSRRIPEGMPERVAGTCPRNRERELARGSDVGYDELGLSGVPVPLERDRKTIGVACVKFNKHDAAPLG